MSIAHHGNPSTAVITMVRDDYFYFSKWMQYYSLNFGRHNLYVIIQGEDETILKLARGASTIKLPIRGLHDTVGNFEFNRHRARVVTSLVESLLNYYETVIYTDVDEFIVVDPALGMSLQSFLDNHRQFPVISPFGLEVIHRRPEEKEEVQVDQPIVGKRHFCQVAVRYTKPIIVRKPVEWSGGFHHSTYPKLHLIDGLYMLHMKWADYKQSADSHHRRYAIKQGKLKVVEGRTEKEELAHYPDLVKLNGKFSEFERYVIERQFDFKHVVRTYVASWRRRRTLLNKEFYASLFGGKEFVRYWRFDFPPQESIAYELPKRFFGIV